LRYGKNLDAQDTLRNHFPYFGFPYFGTSAASAFAATAMDAAGRSHRGEDAG
jgi:hypothetical protein